MGKAMNSRSKGLGLDYHCAGQASHSMLPLPCTPVIVHHRVPGGMKNSACVAQGVCILVYGMLSSL